jgi:4-hydroxy-3-methylbut-2-enyl diphosphate reductase
MVTHGYLPEKEKIRILITSGASCPDAIVESVITKLSAFFPHGKSIEEISEDFK